MVLTVWLKPVTPNIDFTPQRQGVVPVRQFQQVEKLRQVFLRRGKRCKSSHLRGCLVLTFGLEQVATFSSLSFTSTS